MVFFAGGGGLLLLMQPDSSAAAITMLDIIFIFVSSYRSMSYRREYFRFNIEYSAAADYARPCPQVSYTDIQ